MSRPSTTRVIEMTPPGRAAVAVVLVAGPEAVAAVDACFHPAGRRRLTDAPPNRILVGRWGSAAGEELVVCRRSHQSVEVHCHGGVAAVRAVIDGLVKLGCEPQRWQDWLRRTETDPIRAAAQIALAEAPTARTAEVLLDQLDGALSGTVRAVVVAAAANQWPTAIAALEELLAWREFGLHLTTPWRVVLAGPPNVGKSSLLNALVGFQRAIVCDLPGTTRDVVTAATAIDGWPVQLADTAGFRDTGDEVESAGVARATAVAADADLILLVDDARAAEEIPLPPRTPLVRVLHKIDLPHVKQAAADRRIDVATSAVTGEGLVELLAAIGAALVPALPAPGAAVPFTPEQVELLATARAAARRNDAADVRRILEPLVD
jgi:tRNA modification GTPase